MKKNRAHGGAWLTSALCVHGVGKKMHGSLSPSESEWADDVNLTDVTKRSVA